MKNTKIQLSHEQLLRVANHSLGKCFFEDPKPDAKKLYKTLQKGQEIDLVKLNTEQGNAVVCFLELDKSGFVGKLTFDLFLSALASTLQHTSDRLTNNEDLNVLVDEENGDIVFNIPGAVKTDDKMNVMAIGIENKSRGILVYKLHFLDPSQFDL